LGFKFLNFCNRYAISNNDRSTKSGDAAYFFGLDGLIVPAHAGLPQSRPFPERLAPQSGTADVATKIVWNAWRKRTLAEAELHERFILPCSRAIERNQGAEL
jgi:hypothetical protein